MVVAERVTAMSASTRVATESGPNRNSGNTCHLLFVDVSQGNRGVTIYKPILLEFFRESRFGSG